MTGQPFPIPMTRHVPERTCVACRRKRPQAEFRRVARVDGVWALVAGPRTGRGAYVCADSPACWLPGRLRRAFGAQAPALGARLSASDASDYLSCRAAPSGRGTHRR